MNKEKYMQRKEANYPLLFWGGVDCEGKAFKQSQ